MKKQVFMLAAIVMMGMTSTMIAKGKLTNDNVMSKLSDGTYVVNTTTLAKDSKDSKVQPLSRFTSRAIKS